MADIAEFLNVKFLEWQMATGKKQTVRAYAKIIGIKYSTLIGYMNGDHPPNASNLEVLAAAFGYEVYDYLNLSRPTPGIGELRAAYDILDPKQREELADQVDKLITDFLESQGLTKLKG